MGKTGPSYKKLGDLRKNYPDVPIMALTATATKRVQADIVVQLKLTTNSKYFVSSFNRSNLQYVVRPKTSKIIDDIQNLIKTEYEEESGIIYCLSRNDCDNIATKLTSVSKLFN